MLVEFVYERHTAVQIACTVQVDLHNGIYAKNMETNCEKKSNVSMRSTAGSYCI